MIKNKTTLFVISLFVALVLTQTTLAADDIVYITATGNSDQNIINKAITSASAGSTIIMRAGTYVIDKPIYLKSGITLQGEGCNITIITSDPESFRYKNAAMIYLSGVNNVELSNFTLDGGEPSLSVQHPNSGHDWQNGIRVDSGTRDCKIHDLVVRLLDGDAVRAGGKTTNIEAYNMKIECSGHDGFQIWGGDGWKIHNCIINLFINCGVRYANTVNSEVYNCTFYCNTNSGFCGIELEDSLSGISIHDNLFKSIKNKYGLAVATVHAKGEVSIYDNIIYDCKSSPMALGGLSVNARNNRVVSSLNNIGGVGYDSDYVLTNPIEQNNNTENNNTDDHEVNDYNETVNNTDVDEAEENYTINNIILDDKEMLELSLGLTTAPTTETGNGKYQNVLALNITGYNNQVDVNNLEKSLYWYYPDIQNKPYETIVTGYQPAITTA